MKVNLEAFEDAQVLKKLGFFIWQVLLRVPDMSKYCSVHLSKASICLNVPKYALKCNCSDYARVLNMPQLSLLSVTSLL